MERYRMDCEVCGKDTGPRWSWSDKGGLGRKRCLCLKHYKALLKRPKRK